MDTTKLFRSLGLLGAGAAGLAAPSIAHAACTGGATLSGYYGLEIAGQTPTGVGKFLNGVVYFNGACALQANATIGENSSVNSFVTFLGTYGTNPDNTITLSFTLPGETTPETYTVGFSPAFNEALGNETDSSAIASIDMKAQLYPASGNHYVYNNASLKGLFIATCTGIGGVLSDTQFISFDGSTQNYGVFGNVTGIDENNDNATYSYSPGLAGMYGVNSIGNFGGYAVAGATTVGFSGVIDNNLNELQYNVSTAGANGQDLEACIAKRVK